MCIIKWTIQLSNSEGLLHACISSISSYLCQVKVRFVFTRYPVYIPGSGHESFTQISSMAIFPMSLRPRTPSITYCDVGNELLQWTQSNLPKSIHTDLICGLLIAYSDVCLMPLPATESVKTPQGKSYPTFRLYVHLQIHRYCKDKHYQYKKFYSKCSKLSNILGIR